MNNSSNLNAKTENMKNEKTADEMSADAYAAHEMRKLDAQQQQQFLRELPAKFEALEYRVRRIENMLIASTTNEKQADNAPESSAVELWHIRGLMAALDKLSLHTDEFDGFTASQALDYASKYRATGAGDGDPQQRKFRADVLDLIVERHCAELSFNECFNKTGEK